MNDIIGRKHTPKVQEPIPSLDNQAIKVDVKFTKDSSQRNGKTRLLEQNTFNKHYP